ncbi:hypothetical protein ACJRO7_032454 [Eucalyptus globulus]|uniref:Uncharacterized protein n=1 Tax=Eucalyptus globulus TaxID=34317 RepID=A0ABD3JJ68_EUCGL
MAPNADRLADIGREGFALVDGFYSGGTSGPAPKKPYNVPQQHASIPGNKNVINSKKAAEKYRVVIVEYYKKKFAGWRFWVSSAVNL